MRKHYFVLLTVLLFSAMSFAQVAIFTDNFDTYTAGQKLACQNPTEWTTWSNAPCGSEDALISSAQSNTPSNSVVLTQNIDVVKTLPNYTSGVYSVKFKMFIPTGKWGYFNVLQLFAGGGSQWGFQCYLEASGAGRIDAGGANSATFTYPYNQWNDVEVKVDLNANQGQFYYNGSLIHTWVWSGGAFGTGTLNQLGGVNLYGATASDEMYVDNFQIIDQILPVELTSFTVAALGNQVTINWSTATEINNRGFEIERAGAEGNYTTIAFVNGHGTTTETQNYTYVDGNLSSGKYSYRLKQLDYDGRTEIFEAIEVEVTKPLAFELNQNYPNPFNPSTVISFGVDKPGHVKLSVYNLLGQEVAVLVDEFKEAGHSTVNFDAAGFSSGTYFYKLESNGNLLFKKMMLTK